RKEIRKRYLTHDGLWIPKTQASRRPVHITDRMAKLIQTMGLGEPSDWLFVNSAGNQIQQNKTLKRLKKYGLEADVLVDTNPKTGKPWSLIRWHWLRRYHRSRVYACGVRREVSKLAMGHAADPIHDLYRGMDEVVFHDEYAKFDSGLDDALIEQR
ncbi:MAG: hypothetical protein ACYTBZ_15295, partial [Planctomycetota bacterium]